MTPSGALVPRLLATRVRERFIFNWSLPLDLVAEHLPLPFPSSRRRSSADPACTPSA